MVFRKKQQSNILNDNNSKSFSIMQTPKATHRFLAFMTIGLLIILIWYIVFLTEGSPTSLAHLMYLPIILGAYFFKSRRTDNLNSRRAFPGTYNAFQD